MPITRLFVFLSSQDTVLHVGLSKANISVFSILVVPEHSEHGGEQEQRHTLIMRLMLAICTILLPKCGSCGARTGCGNEFAYREPTTAPPRRLFTRSPAPTWNVSLCHRTPRSCVNSWSVSRIFTTFLPFNPQSLFLTGSGRRDG